MLRFCKDYRKYVTKIMIYFAYYIFFLKDKGNILHNKNIQGEKILLNDR